MYLYLTRIEHFAPAFRRDAMTGPMSSAYIRPVASECRSCPSCMSAASSTPRCTTPQRAARLNEPRVCLRLQHGPVARPRVPPLVRLHQARLRVLYGYQVYCTVRGAFVAFLCVCTSVPALSWGQYRLSLYCPQDRGCGHVPNALRANRAYATRLGQRHHTIIPP